MTLVLSISSYTVANAVPFFKDLLALIGSLTSVPLTLTLPLVLHRRSWNMPVWIPTLHSLASYAILMFSLVFLFLGLVGALGSIELDWSQQGTPFACTL
jgi:amino acid permease